MSLSSPKIVNGLKVQFTSLRSVKEKPVKKSAIEKGLVATKRKSETFDDREPKLKQSKEISFQSKAKPIIQLDLEEMKGTNMNKTL